MNSQINVLLIEDNPGDARLVREELRSAPSGYHIHLEWVDCLQKGLGFLTENVVQAVLVDLSLSDSHGLDTLHTVLLAAPQTPVIVMTGLADEETGLQALQAGAQDYLIKGEVNGSLLTRAIRYAMQRKQTEIQLADARGFTERILTSAPVGIFTYKLSGECLSANAAAARMVGATIEQLECQNFHQLESWKRSGLYELAQTAIGEKRPTAADVHVITTFGKEAWYHAQFVTFKSGGEDLLLMIFNDITEHKQAEAALEASEKRFRAWIENSSDIITVLDAGGVIQYESPSVKRSLGYAPEELLGKIAFDFIHPDDQDRIVSTFAENIQNLDAAVSAEYRFRHRDGSWRILEGIGQAYVDEHDELVALVHSRDTTERKKAEEALRDGEIRYRTLMEKSLEAIYLYELESKRVMTANPAFLELLGYSAEEAGTLTLYDIVQHDRNSIDAFLEQIQVEGATAMGERLWRRKDGTTVPVEVTANKIQQGDTDIIFVVGRDVTERKQAEKALREKEHLLSEAQRIGHIGSWSYDIPGDTMKFSDEMYRLLDVQPEEFHHNRADFLALVYPSDRPAAARWMESLEEGTQTKDLNFRLFHKNGELRYLHCTGAVEFDSHCKPSRFIGTVQDVTDRRTAEIQIDQQIKRLTALSEIDHAIISSFDQRYTLRVILSHMISQLQVDAADILLVDPEGRLLKYAAGQGFRTKLAETAGVLIGEGHAGRVAKERRMIRIPDLREVTNLLEFQAFVMAEGFVGYIAVPLVVKGNVKGVLEVYQRSVLQPYREWLEFFNTLAGQTAIAIENTSLFENLQATNRELVQAYDATIEGWSRAMDLRDRETEGHTERVTKLTLELARALRVDESRLVHIRRGALLHDIGKLGVPDHILFKPGELTVEERAMIEQHVDFAYEMLAPIPYLKPALSIPYFHHEKWDGTGYPLGLKGEQIPLEARIFSLADVWDALCSDRPYRKAWSRQQTIEYIQSQSGIHFDPKVVECFLKLIHEIL
jgi:PAS domain S-box-containing protein/putative nucleotidyltransferase with HDIG domain